MAMENHSKNVHPENIGIIKPPTSSAYLNSRKRSGNKFVFLPKEAISCMNPMGQIHPQKALPRIAAMISMMTAITRDKIWTWVPARIALRLNRGSIFHRSLIGADGLVIPYSSRIMTWACTMCLKNLIFMVEEGDRASVWLDVFSLVIYCPSTELSLHHRLLW